LVIRHASTSICLQRYVLILTLRLAVYMLFSKNKISIGQKILHPQTMHSSTPMQPLYICKTTSLGHVPTVTCAL